MRVGGGATWGEVDAATQAFGLATPGARVPDVGVAGFVLSGGHGWLSSAYGSGARQPARGHRGNRRRRRRPLRGRAAPRRRGRADAAPAPGRRGAGRQPVLRRRAGRGGARGHARRRRRGHGRARAASWRRCAASRWPPSGSARSATRPPARPARWPTCARKLEPVSTPSPSATTPASRRPRARPTRPAYGHWAARSVAALPAAALAALVAHGLPLPSVLSEVQLVPLGGRTIVSAVAKWAYPAPAVAAAHRRWADELVDALDPSALRQSAHGPTTSSARSDHWTACSIAPQALDLDPHHVARLQVLRRLHRVPDAAGVPVEDDVPGRERAGLGDQVDELLRAEDQVGRVRVLAQLSVDVADDAQADRVRELVRGRDPRPPGAGCVEALRARPLPLGLLEVAAGDVVGRRPAGDSAGRAPITKADSAS